MSTNSTQESVYGTGFSPLMGEPRTGLIPIPQKTATAITLSSGTVTARTATAAECLGGLFIITCNDASTLTLPTATLLNAAVPAAAVGAAFDIDIVNVGDDTLTVAVGTGGTLVVGNSKSSVATIGTMASKRLTILITGVTENGSASDAYQVIGMGSIAAATA